MHSNLKRLPAARARHGNRLPVQAGPDDPPIARQFSLAGPITITQIIPITNTAGTAAPATTTTTSTPILPPIGTGALTNNQPTVSNVPVVPSAPVAPSAPIQSVPVAAPSAPVAAPSAPVAPSSPFSVPVPNSAPAPVASAINPANSNANEGAANTNGVAAVSSQHGLPTGAIVGITIACVMLVLGAFVFFIRQRSIRNRKLRRMTAPWPAPQQTHSSFEPRAVPTAYGPASAANTMGETSPGVSFARSQAQALAARGGPPPMPQPPQSSYNNPAMPVVVAPAGAAPSAAVRFEFIPTLPDELSITTGETVRMLSEFDDGWALCANARGEQGMVPLECLERGPAPRQLQAEQQNYRNSRRTSSLASGRY